MDKLGINNLVKQWAIVSWQHDDLKDGRYGHCVAIVEGTYDEASEAAREYVPMWSPVSVCGIVQ